MTTHQFFIKQSQIDKNNMLTIRGKDARHMALVLRLKSGSRIRLVDEMQRLYLGSVERVSGDTVVISIMETVDCALEQARVNIVQGIPRLPKADLIVQKLAELGVAAITFVPMERTPYTDGFERMQKRLERLSSIAEAAAKQCGRLCLPAIRTAENVEEALGALPAALWLVANEKTAGYSAGVPTGGGNVPAARLRTILADVDASSRVGIIVGPEGGFSENELHLFARHEFRNFSLGRNILRTETAAIVAAAVVLYELGEI